MMSARFFTPLICWLVTAATVLVGASSSAAPTELGRVNWLRRLDDGVAQARQAGKPVLVLFQEVPGCSTCQQYGSRALSHPLIVEAIESQFVPVAVFNNRGGEDRETLTSFNEPAWNNPVVRIINPERKDLVRRLNGDYSRAGLVEHMVAALEGGNRPVPAYLRLLDEELSARAKGLKKAVYSMPCFWSGEANLGALPGVIATRPGFAGGREVVEVWFDPSSVSAKDLHAHARSWRYRDQGGDLSIRPDGQPKYQLRQHRLRHVPMTETQAARVNGALGTGRDPGEWLSPRQRELWFLVQAHPSASWPWMIDRIDLTQAWDEAWKIAQSLPADPAVSMQMTR
jgi:hypothetical protein